MGRAAVPEKQVVSPMLGAGWQLLFPGCPVWEQELYRAGGGGDFGAAPIQSRAGAGM